MTATPIQVLDRLAGYIVAAREAALVATGMIRSGSTFRPSDLVTAEQKTQEAMNAAQSALELLHAEGAHPDTMPMPSVMGVPLDKLNTPANRALLAALESAVQLAEEVDKERGLSVPEADRLGPNDTLGIDLAEQINQIRARVSLEIHGPKGSGRE